MEPYQALEPAEKYTKYLKEVTPHFRKLFNGPLITNVDFNFESGNKIIEDGHADMVAFGKLFISNPDLVERFENGSPLTPWDESTFYYGGEKGYIDYPCILKFEPHIFEIVFILINDFIMPKTEVFFTKIQDTIVEAINLAEASIDIASAWITNVKIHKALIESAKRNVKIRLVFNNDLPQL